MDRQSEIAHSFIGFCSMAMWGETRRQDWQGPPIAPAMLEKLRLFEGYPWRLDRTLDNCPAVEP
jgi:hypothetical protein